MKELPAVKQTILSMEKYNAFIDSYVKNENDPNYDVWDLFIKKEILKTELLLVKYIFRLI